MEAPAHATAGQHVIVSRERILKELVTGSALQMALAFDRVELPGRGPVGGAGADASGGARCRFGPGSGCLPIGRDPLLRSRGQNLCTAQNPPHDFYGVTP